MKYAYLLLGLLLLGCGKDEGPKVPPAVDLLFPDNNSECTTGISRTETTSEVEFRWAAAQYAVRYELNVRNLATGFSESTITTALSARVILDKGAAYSWNVVARNQEGQAGPAGVTRQFFNAGSLTSYPPFPALPEYPASGATVGADTNGQVTLRWSGADADGDLTEYEVYFGTDAANLPLSGSQTSGLLTRSVPVTPGGTVYYWEILSRDAEGNTSRSGIYSFRIL